MNWPSITLKELLLGLAIFVVVSIVAMAVVGGIKVRQQNRYITVGQSLKVTEPDKMSYAVKTNVGNILAYGKIEAIQPQEMPEIKDKYATIERVEEHYNLHYRAETYQCGKSTCTRMVPYWSWDYYDGQEKKTNGYFVLGTPIFNACGTQTSDVNLDDTYQGSDKHDRYYAYPKSSAFGNGNVRYSWQASPISRDGTVFIRAFNDGISDPFGGSCIPVKEGQELNKVVEGYVPHIGWVVFGFLLLVATIVGVYIWAASEYEIL